MRTKKALSAWIPLVSVFCSSGAVSGIRGKQMTPAVASERSIFSENHDYNTYGTGHKKVPVFLNTLPCNGKFAFVFVSVAFYNLPCFYCCVSILKARREERLKNGKKNGGKTVQKKRLEK